MSRNITIEFPDEATDEEINLALENAEILAIQCANSYRLRTLDPQTRRYVWFDIAGAFHKARS
jgi:GAF domain-containing protein